MLPFFIGCAKPSRRNMERVMGIEPTFEAWEAPVLPLNYTRMGTLYADRWMHSNTGIRIIQASLFFCFGRYERKCTPGTGILPSLIRSLY